METHTRKAATPDSSGARRTDAAGPSHAPDPRCGRAIRLGAGLVAGATTTGLCLLDGPPDAIQILLAATTWTMVGLLGEQHRHRLRVRELQAEARHQAEERSARMRDDQQRIVELRAELGRLELEKTERLQQHHGRLIALLDVSRMMGLETPQQDVFDCITRSCLESFEAHQSTLFLLDPITQELEVRSAAGHANVDAVRATRLGLGQGVAGRVAATRTGVVLGPEGPDPAEYGTIQGKTRLVSAAMVAPIVVRDELMGVLCVASRRFEARYEDGDFAAFQVFAQNVGTCIRHNQQTEWMRQALISLDIELTEKEAMLRRYVSASVPAPRHLETRPLDKEDLRPASQVARFEPQPRPAQPAELETSLR
jgi:hypothetical protein